MAGMTQSWRMRLRLFCIPIKHEYALAAGYLARQYGDISGHISCGLYYGERYCGSVGSPTMNETSTSLSYNFPVSVNM
jgi:hypothetical protein